jgi:hypothetical protein
MDSKQDRLAAIEERIAGRMPGLMQGAFPGAEIRKICPAGPDTNEKDLYVAADLYLADIAGYTSSARKIRKLPLETLLKIRERLSKPFYERYEGMDRFRTLITPETTPRLYAYLEAAEMNREDLIKLIDTIREEENRGV